jgi:hypothetical protein
VDAKWMCTGVIEPSIMVSYLLRTSANYWQTNFVKSIVRWARIWWTNLNKKM